MFHSEKLIVNSPTYKLSMNLSDKSVEKDPEPKFILPSHATENWSSSIICSEDPPKNPLKNLPKIVDAFTFYNELDILYYRLTLLYDIVDYFIIVEATRTFTGKNKPLYYNLHKNDERFIKFTNKIIHIIDDGLEKDPVVSQKDILSRTNKYWQNEYHQRNSIDIGIKQLAGEQEFSFTKKSSNQLLSSTSEKSIEEEQFAVSCEENVKKTKLNKIKEGDFIIISDVDEIPNPSFLKSIKNIEKEISEFKTIPEILVLIQDIYYYDITCKVMEYWNFAKIVKYEYYKTKMESSPQKIRTIQQISNENLYNVEKGGWHLSYFETAENIKKRLESFSHQEFNNHIIANLTYISYCIKNKKSLYNRSFDKIIHVPIKENTNLPPLYEIFFEIP